MNATGKFEWDWFMFTSHISVEFNIQIISIDKANEIIRLEDGYFDSRKIEKKLTKKALAEVEKCFKEISIYE